jgi:hypothetical protein
MRARGARKICSYQELADPLSFSAQAHFRRR